MFIYSVFVVKFASSKTMEERRRRRRKESERFGKIKYEESFN
jgi:hypothetical protein